MRLTKEQIEKELDDLNGYLGKHQLSGYGVEWLEGKTVYAVKTYVKKSGNDGHVWFITNWIDEAKNAKRMILRYLHLEYYGKHNFPFEVTIEPYVLRKDEAKKRK